MNTCVASNDVFATSDLVRVLRDHIEDDLDVLALRDVNRTCRASIELPKRVVLEVTPTNFAACLKAVRKLRGRITALELEFLDARDAAGFVACMAGVCIEDRGAFGRMEELVILIPDPDPEATSDECIIFCGFDYFKAVKKLVVFEDVDESMFFIHPDDAIFQRRRIYDLPPAVDTIQLSPLFRLDDGLPVPESLRWMRWNAVLMEDEPLVCGAAIEHLHLSTENVYARHMDAIAGLSKLESLYLVAMSDGDGDTDDINLQSTALTTLVLDASGNGDNAEFLNITLPPTIRRVAMRENSNVTVMGNGESLETAIMPAHCLCDIPDDACDTVKYLHIKPCVTADRAPLSGPRTLELFVCNTDLEKPGAFDFIEYFAPRLARVYVLDFDLSGYNYVTEIADGGDEMDDGEETDTAGSDDDEETDTTDDIRAHIERLKRICRIKRICPDVRIIDSDAYTNLLCAMFK